MRGRSSRSVDGSFIGTYGNKTQRNGLSDKHLQVCKNFLTSGFPFSLNSAKDHGPEKSRLNLDRLARKCSRWASTWRSCRRRRAQAAAARPQAQDFEAQRPEPIKKIVGDLSDKHRVLAGGGSFRAGRCWLRKERPLRVFPLRNRLAQHEKNRYYGLNSNTFKMSYRA